jgi:hypothetical protein
MTAITFHTGLVVPERVITNINKFAHQDFIPNWLSSLPTVIEALCAKWQIELEPLIADTWITVVLFGTSPVLGLVVVKSSPNAVDVVAQARAFEIGAGDNSLASMTLTSNTARWSWNESYRGRSCGTLRWTTMFRRVLGQRHCAAFGAPS